MDVTEYELVLQGFIPGNISCCIRFYNENTAGLRGGSDRCGSYRSPVMGGNNGIGIIRSTLIEGSQPSKRRWRGIRRERTCSGRKRKGEEHTDKEWCKNQEGYAAGKNVPRIVIPLISVHQ